MTDTDTVIDIAPILGLSVYLWRSKDRPCSCGKNIIQRAIIGEGAAPHAASVRCSWCNRHRGWLPAQAVLFWSDTARIFGKLDYVILQDTTVDDDATAAGEAVAVPSTDTRHGAMTMGLGFKYGSGAGVSFIKFDARAGRFFRNDRVEKPKGSGKYENSAVEITANFRAIMDLENVEVGYALFVEGQAPQYLLVPSEAEWPVKPGKEWKQAVRAMLKLDPVCGGDIREVTSTALAFLAGFEKLHEEFDTERHKHPGKLPVVVLRGTEPVPSGGKSTNYRPNFAIVEWVDRPDDLVFVPKSGAYDDDAA